MKHKDKCMDPQTQITLDPDILDMSIKFGLCISSMSNTFTLKLIYNATTSPPEMHTVQHVI